MAEIKRIEVTLVQHPDDGTDRQITVATDNRDRIRWELTSARQHWPDPTAAPTLWATFLAWSAMKRAGDTRLDFEAFSDTVLMVEADAVSVGPTRTATTAD